MELENKTELQLKKLLITRFKKLDIVWLEWLNRSKNRWWSAWALNRDLDNIKHKKDKIIEECVIIFNKLQEINHICCFDWCDKYAENFIYIPELSDILDAKIIYLCKKCSENKNTN